MNLANTTHNNPMVVPLPAYEDNYIWVIQDSDTLILVDPGQAEPVLDWLALHQRIPNAILVTHTHHDHVDGIAAICERFPHVAVYGHKKSNYPSISHPLTIDQLFSINHLTFKVVDCSGHTPDHLGYHCQNHPWFFSGDALFAAGCGRLFNGGTAEQMNETLNRISNIPEATSVFCGHEYTLANIRFAHMVEPSNDKIQQRLQKISQQRRLNECTLPSTISNEIETNPFLRRMHPQVMQAIESWSQTNIQSETHAFALLRSWKDSVDRTGILDKAP